MACPARYRIMERNNFKTQIKQRIVVYAALALVAYGAFACFCSSYCTCLSKRQDSNVNVLVLTNSPMFISYNPKAKKAVVSVIAPEDKNSTLQDVLSKAAINPNDFLYIEPSLQSRSEFWDSFKDNLHMWRYKPFIIFQYFYDYAKLRYKGKTDIKTADFIMLSLELSSLAPADFSVISKEQPKAAPKKRRVKKEEPQPQIALAEDIIKPQENKKPIVIEILNASGKSGLAADVTRYLRELNNNETLNLDVINYANYTQEEPSTIILNNTGDLEQLKKISLYLDLGDKEIFSKSDKISISDAKIILGRDFVLPKNINK